MKYKTGDKVRILPNAVENDGATIEWVGCVGVVIRESKVFPYYLVEMSNGQWWILDDAEIELVEKEER